MATPAKGNAAVAAWRARQRLAGLRPFQVWIHPENWERLKKYAAKLAKTGVPK